MTCGQVWKPILGISALHLTHLTHLTHEHTHHEHTPGAVAVSAAVPGEQLGVWCLTGSLTTIGHKFKSKLSIHKGSPESERPEI